MLFISFSSSVFVTCLLPTVIITLSLDWLKRWQAENENKKTTAETTFMGLYNLGFNITFLKRNLNVVD